MRRRLLAVVLLIVLQGLRQLNSSRSVALWCTRKPLPPDWVGRSEKAYSNLEKLATKRTNIVCPFAQEWVGQNGEKYPAPGGSGGVHKHVKHLTEMEKKANLRRLQMMSNVH